MRYLISSLICIVLVASCAKKNQVTQQNPPRGDANPIGETAITVNLDDSLFISGTLAYHGREDLVIIIPGSGPTDRNGNNQLGVKANTYQMLATQLGNKKISSFRYDKLGIGASSRVPETQLTFDSSAEDVANIIFYFDKQFDRVHLVGHSEGALIASIVGNTIEEIESITLIAGTSVQYDKILNEQLPNVLEGYPALIAEGQQHIQEIKEGKELSEVSQVLQAIFRPSVVPFFNSAFKIDPIAEVSRLECRLSIIGGKCDIQVSEKHAIALGKANTKASVLLIDNMGHVLKDLNANCDNAQAAYNDVKLTLHPELVDRVVSTVNIKSN